jgi:hypothetical protein
MATKNVRRPGGGYGSRVNVEPRVRTGQRGEAVNERAVSQIGQSMSNEITEGTKKLNPVEKLRGAQRPTNTPGGVPLGNEVALNVGKVALAQDEPCTAKAAPIARPAQPIQANPEPVQASPYSQASNKESVMSKSEELAFAGMFATTQPDLAEQLRLAEIQEGIRRTMIDVVRHDAKHNPNQHAPSGKVSPSGAVPVSRPGEVNTTGWREPLPLASPNSADRIVEAMIDNELGPVKRTGPMEIIARTEALVADLKRQRETAQDKEGIDKIITRAENALRSWKEEPTNKE